MFPNSCLQVNNVSKLDFQLEFYREKKKDKLYKYEKLEKIINLIY